MHEILQSIQTYVIEEFKKSDTSKLYYHSLEHTKGVVQNVASMIENLVLKEEEAFILSIAAWWHDIGYLYGYEEHEERGMRLAAAFLPSMGVNTLEVKQVQALIAATQLGQNPNSLLEALLADADLAYGVTHNFKQCGDQLRKEWAWYKSKSYTELEWAELQLQFLQNIQFHSKWGQQKYQPLVDQNIKKQVIQLATLTKE